MVEKLITPSQNVVDFARYQSERNASDIAPAIQARTCRHCGAALSEGESEQECSSAFNFEALGTRVATRKFYSE
jgi:RNase P subunit RPR2